MLPFLKAKPGSAIATVKKIETGADEGDWAKSSSELDPGLLAASDALIAAIQKQDTKEVAQALKDAFMICDSCDEDQGMSDDREG